MDLLANPPHYPFTEFSSRKASRKIFEGAYPTCEQVAQLVVREYSMHSCPSGPEAASILGKTPCEHCYLVVLAVVSPSKASKSRSTY